MYDLSVNKIVQIIPCSGLWIHSIVVQGDPLPATVAEFKPIVAVVLAEVHVSYEPAVVSDALLPIDSDGLMVGLLERSPNERLRVDRLIYHDADFEVFGHRLKTYARPRSCYNYTQEDGDDFVASYYYNHHSRGQPAESTAPHDHKREEGEDFRLEKIIQIIPTSGLWMDRIVNDGLPLPGPDFTPIVGIAMVQITSPNERFVLPQAVIPFTSDDLMRGLFAKSANGGFRVERKVFHDADFDELGFRLKPKSVERSFYNFARADAVDYARHVLDREQRRNSDSDSSKA
ncbi:MAG TPA: hypothetical protein VK148_02020 [Xanthobacteraceae bacterium]|nr:hypothetical protein [Xanthobacteraceae bacterium]